ncbi:MAG: hypothetical protein IJR92_01375 [Alphaproteobacteria bacterium]|nr:hypothetical protein [Alphaproteobacteria bacterium]
MVCWNCGQYFIGRPKFPIRIRKPGTQNKQ